MNMKLLILSLLALLNLNSINAKTVELETGNRLFDTSRVVEIDHFDYIYPLKAVHLGGYFVELEDGSVWQVEELSPEVKSFYENKGTPLENEFVENVVNFFWQPGQHLIFHKVIDRESILIYNIEQDQLFDFVPLSPPIYETLMIASMDLYLNKTIDLSDGSVWRFDHLCPCKKWKVGDPIIIAKDTSWLGQTFLGESNTHILINMKYCECDATKGHIHPNRLGVRRIQ